jgi:hypothetical protein
MIAVTLGVDWAWLNPGAMKPLERRVAKENGQRYLVPPSSVVR